MACAINTVLLLSLLLSFSTVEICHGQDFFIAVRKPQGDCPTNELDTLRPSSEYIVATTTVLPGQTNTDIGVEIIVTGPVPMNTFLAWDITSDGFSVFWVPGGQNVTEDFVVVATEGDTELELQASTANDINYLRFENLKPATVYEIRLMTGSTILSSNRTLTKPNPVTLLSLESATATTLGLRWNAPRDDVNSYRICYQAQNMNRIEMTQFDQTTVELQNLQSGTVYSISVTACSNVNGLTRCSTTTYRYFATVSTSIPTTPDTIRVDNIDSNTVRLSWDLPSGSLEAFELDYSPQFGFPPPPIRMPASQSSFQLEYLLSSTDYQFSLVATSGRKLAKVQSSATEMSSRTDDGPFDVQIYNIQETSAVILYGREPQAVTYRISYLVEGQSSGQDVRQDSDIPRLLPLYNLSPNTTYNVIITAFNAVQTELGRVETTFQTLLPPSVMSIVEEFTATYVSLSIPLPSLPDVEQYQVQLHLAGDGGFGAAIGEPVTIDRSVCPRVEFGNLRPDSLYEVVTSVIVGGRRTQGTVVGVNTKSLGPLEVSLSAVGTTSVELVWGPAAGNFTGYNLTYVSPDSVSISVSLDPSLERYLLTNLQPGTVYVVLLRQIGGPLFFTGEVVTRPLTPSSLRFQDVRTQSLTAVWDSPHTSFEICYSPVGNLPSPYRLEQTELDFVNLQAATETSVTVYAVSMLGTFSYRSFPVTATGRTLDREPGDVQVDGFTTTTIDISWIGLPQQNVEYSILYDVDGLDGSSNSATTTNTEYTLTNLLPGELYNISVVPIGTSFVPSRTIQRTLPNSPGDISVQFRDETFMQLRWSEAPRGTNYRYRLQVLNPQLQVVTEIFVMSSDVLVENLVPGTKYTFVLTSVSGNGFFETESLPINITAITLLHIDVMTGPSSIRMIWEEPDVGTFDRYEINYEPCINQPCSQEVPSNFPGAFINGITPGSVVTVRVTLKNDFGEIMLIGVIIVSLVPLEVSNLRYTSRRTEIILEWDANTLYDSFEIDYEPMDGLFGGGINVTSWPVVIQGLTPGQEYTFNVTTIANDVRSTRPASILALTIPEAIETFEVRDIGNGDINIAWIPPVMLGLPIDEYLVRIRPDGNERDTILRSIPPTETTDRYNGATGFYFDVSLTSVVRGQQGDTSESEPVSAGVLLAPAPAILNTPTDEDVGATFADLSWMTTGSRLYYEIFYDSNSTGESNRTIPATENTFRLDDLTPSTLYNVSLEAVSEFQIVDGELIESRSDPSFLMISTKSLPPRNLSTLSVEATSVTWVWLPPNDTANTYSYIVQVSPGQLSQEINATIFDALGLNDETEYTINVFAVLGMSQSLPLQDTVTTLSSRPSIITGFGTPVTPSTNVTLVWDSPKPGDDVRYIQVKINGSEEAGSGVDQRVINASRTSTSLRVSGLRPAYRYNFSICAVNNHGSSDPTTDGPYLIPETAPPQSPLKVQIVSTTTTSMTVEIFDPFFSHVNGPIVNYALLVTTGSEDDVVSSVPNTYIQAQKFTVLPPYQTTPVTFNPYDIRARDGSGQYIIGTNTECVLESNFPEDEYCNGPLKSSTSYRVALRGYGVDGKFQDSLWSDPAVTGFALWILIAIIVGIFVVLVLVIILFCCICCCCSSKQSKPARRKRLHPEENSVKDATSLDDFRLPGDEEEEEENSSENEFVPELTSYRKKRTLGSTQQKYRKSKKSNSRRRTADSTSSAGETVNPGFDDQRSMVSTAVSTPTSNPVVIGQFQEHVMDMSTPHNFGFKTEYETMKTVNIVMTMDVALKPENVAKNRYKDIIPYDANRVRLMEVHEGSTDYINASSIKLFTWHQYISTQGPLPDTVKDFWQMVWENRSTTIVMLSNLVENGKVRCVQYWADLDTSLTFGDYTVTGIGVTTKENWEIRDLTLSKNGVPIAIRQFHFHDWADHGTPVNPLPMLDFIHEVRGRDAINLGPLLVHCSAGCGRSGTYIAADALIRRIETSTIYDKIDVLNTVFSLRKQRPKMVQTVDQYTFLHRCLTAYIQEKFF